MARIISGRPTRIHLIDIGNTTVNLIPGEARARFNIRYNDHSLASLKMRIEKRMRAAAGERIRLPHRLAAFECLCVPDQARPVRRSRGAPTQ